MVARAIREDGMLAVPLFGMVQACPSTLWVVVHRVVMVKVEVVEVEEINNCDLWQF